MSFPIPVCCNVHTRLPPGRRVIRKQKPMNDFLDSTHAGAGTAAHATRRTILRAGTALGIGAATRTLHADARVLAQDTAATPWPTAGWRLADPADMGMDTNLLSQLDARVASETPLLTALLVVRGGNIVFENYYNGMTADQPFHCWSVTKSITGIGVGVAFHEGLIGGIDQTLGELIPDRIPDGADPRVADITVKDLLTMTGGWEWDGRSNFQRHAETDDLDFDLTRTMVCDPGVCFEYDNGCPNLLSYIIQAHSGETMADYLQPRLFDPLGIAPPTWFTTVDGATRGAGGLDLTARDLAKLGYLFLRDGQWDGSRIVDPEWVASSTEEQSSGTSDVSGVNIGNGGVYGYLWWVMSQNDPPAYFASGFGGQLLYVVPALDLIVATGMTPIEAEETDLQQNVMPLVEGLIVPAALA